MKFSSCLISLLKWMNGFNKNRIYDKVRNHLLSCWLRAHSKYLLPQVLSVPAEFLYRFDHGGDVFSLAFVWQAGTPV
jgi:hypothetical protein